MKHVLPKLSKRLYGDGSLSKCVLLSYNSKTNPQPSYPHAAKQHIHTTLAHVPLDVARALSVNPSLVQKPVESFYTRDALQLRVSYIIFMAATANLCGYRPLIG
jgi:hypothetical protein